MPRRNRTQPHVRAQRAGTPETKKVKYLSKQAAALAAKRASIYNPDVVLKPYQSPSDGAWYLTTDQNS